MLLLLGLFHAAHAAPFTAKPAKWSTQHTLCSARMATGSGAREGTITRGLDELRGVMDGDPPGHSTSWKSGWLATPQDKGRFIVAPYAGFRSPLDYEVEHAYPSHHPLILQLDLAAMGPRSLVDESGRFVGLATWDLDTWLPVETSRFAAAGVNKDELPFWTSVTQALWHPDTARTNNRAQWNLHVEGWLGTEVGAPERVVNETLPNGIAMSRTWTNQPSTACGPKITTCVQLDVVEVLADPAAATAAFRAAGQPVPEGAEVYVRNTTTTWVDAKTMQVFGWRYQRHSGGRATATDKVEIEATDIRCNPVQ